MGHWTSIFLLLVSMVFEAAPLIPPKFQWKALDFAWTPQEKEAAIHSGKYIANNNMPTGLARWKNKLFITIPRWKKGVPSSLNYVYLNGTRQEPLHPYPNWEEASLTDDGDVTSNRTVVSTFRVHVDKQDRLWVVDNGVSEILSDVKQVTMPAVLVFDLNTDELIHKHILDDNLLSDASVLTSIVVEITDNKQDSGSFAYITDMGSNAVIVFDLVNDDAWRIEHHYFHFDPHAGVYKVGGLDFYWRDGISSAALSAPNKHGFCDLYFQPTSSTKLFKMSTSLLRRKDVPKEEIFNGVETIGDRGPNSQVSACDIDPKTNVLFYTQVCKNGVGCWNINKPFSREHAPLILSDCTLMEFPSDIKVDNDGQVWMLSNRQSRYLYSSMDCTDINYRVLTASSTDLIYGTKCAKKSLW